MGDPLDQKQAEDRLWKEIDHHRQGMLGVVGGTPHHFQPMTQFAERDTGALWFFTRTDTELVRQLDDGKAMFVLQDDKFQACIGADCLRTTTRSGSTASGGRWSRPGIPTERTIPASPSCASTLRMRNCG